jgi:hypothetical protein
MSLKLLGLFQLPPLFPHFWGTWSQYLFILSTDNHHPNYLESVLVKSFLALLALIIFGYLDIPAMFCLHLVSELS